MQLNRITGSLLVAFLVIAGLVWGFWPAARPVESAAATRAPLRVTVEEEGMARVKDRFVISAPVAGYLQRIELKVGDPVTPGQALALLEPLRPAVLDARSRAEAEARVAAASAAVQGAEQQVSAAQAQADFARTDLQRKQELAKQSLVSREQLQQAETQQRQSAAQLHSAQFSVEVARYDLAAARTALQYSVQDKDTVGSVASAAVALSAPLAGRVLQLHHESEGVVSLGEPLLDIGDPTALEIAVDVLSADAVRIRPGTRVNLLRWGGTQDLQAVVRTVEPTGFTRISALGVEEQRVWVIADLVSPRSEWETLGDGYRVVAEFVLWQDEQVLQVPASALFRVGEQWTVFVIEHGAAHQRSVQIGRSSGLATQVLGGVEEGERVILHPDDRIADGVRVTDQ